MDKYTFCYEANCSKFKKAQEEALNKNNSSMDAAIDMWYFVDDCCKTCKKMPEDLKNN